MTREVITRANVVAIAAVLALVALFGGLNWLQTDQTQQARAWAKHTNDVIGMVKDLHLTLRSAESGQRGFLLTDNPAYLAPYEAALDHVSFLQGELQRLTADNPMQQGRLRALSPILQRKFEELGQTIQLRRDGMPDAALKLVNTDVGLLFTRDIEVILASIEETEQRLLAERIDDVNRGIARVRWTSMAGACLAAIAILWAAHMLNRAWRRSYRAELAQRRLAMQLRATLDSLSQGVAVFSPARALRQWNACFQILLDVPAAMLREDMPYAAFAEHTGQAGMALESDATVRVTGTPSEIFVYTCERAGQDRFGGHQLEVRRTTMPDGGFVLTVSDMTKRAQAEAVLREAQKMQAIGQLTGGIAHDFNNLLTVILGNLEFAAARLTGHQAILTRIERAVWAAQRGATLTSHLLAFARKQPLAPAPVDLATGLADLMPLLRRTLGEHIDIRVVDSAGLWPALADASQLENAILNLALNARDAMPGGGRLTIEMANKVLDRAYANAHGEVVPGEYAMLAVSDTGVGMTPEVAARVFEPFFTTKPDGKGTGLGLAMVFGFVKQSGGHIKVYSEPGEGTSIKIYLPRAIAGAAPLQRSVVTSEEVPRGSASILVVEDEPEVREIAVAILSDLGYRVLQAGDGAEGLRVFGAHAGEIELLLTDVVLPGEIRGRDVAERITAMHPGTKVLYMSGYTENAIVHHGRLDEGVHLISKPFKREQLGRKVAEVLGRSSQAEGGNIVDIKSRLRDQ